MGENNRMRRPLGIPSLGCARGDEGTELEERLPQKRRRVGSSHAVTHARKLALGVMLLRHIFRST
jgi:hypothetical protein